MFVYITFGKLYTKIQDENSDGLLMQTVIAQTDNNDCLTMDFRYLVISVARYTPVSQRVDVFLDDKAFSEKNLKTLFTHLAKRYSGTKILIIIVSTNWKQLPLSSDCPPRGLSDTSSEAPEEFEYHQAEYFRNEEVEYFRYNPVLNTENFKKVILKRKENKP